MLTCCCNSPCTCTFTRVDRWSVSKQVHLSAQRCEHQDSYCAMITAVGTHLSFTFLSNDVKYT